MTLGLTRVLTLAACLMTGVGFGQDPPSTDSAKTEPDSGGGEGELGWLDSLDAGYRQALTNRQPIFVVVGGPGCPYCRILEAEMRKPLVQDELKRWTRVKLDVEQNPEESRTLAVGPIPALRLLTPTGKLVVSTEGAQPAEELVEWLQANREELLDSAVDALADTGPPNELEVRRLVRLFRRKDATVREAAIRRLMPYPDEAARNVVESFSGGSLGMKLCALELLNEWQAPVEGLDPWRPQTLSLARLSGLTKWAEESGHAPAEHEELTAEQHADAARTIDELLSAPLAESRAVRERLARFGPALLPEVRKRIQSATTDRGRERLTALRYRLVASQALAIEWPAGFEQLASSNLAERQRAVTELAERAGAADEPLLLELFSDPAAIIREISLRALKKIGGTNARSALVGLLNDPDPNVRAAVLTQLAESPSPAIVPRIAEYVKTETDPDLIVHAARLFREAKGTASVEALVGLLDHTSWQVRAEAAEAIGKIINEDSSSRAVYKFAYDALLKRLDDDDGFVISRAMEALGDGEPTKTIEPIVAVASKHPELAAEVVKRLTEAGERADLVVPHLREFCRHAKPEVRAAAIKGLTNLTPEGCKDELRTLMQDRESTVRAAAAGALFGLLEQQMRQQSFDDSAGAVVERIEAAESGGSSGGFAETLVRSLFGLGPKKATEATREPEPVAENAAEAPLVAPRPEGEESVALAGDAGRRLEKYLRRIRSGEALPKWMFEFVPLLEAMLQAESKSEKITAAITLAALGRDDLALPVLEAGIQTQPRYLASSARALPWLLWPDRIRLFDAMEPLAESEVDVRSIVYGMSSTYDLRALPAIWSPLDGPRASAATAEVITTGLTQVFFHNYYFNFSNVTKQQRDIAEPELSKRSRTGSYWQRLVALRLLRSLSADAMIPIAQSIVEDRTEADPLRRDAFRLLLAAKSEREATAFAADVLARDDELLQDDALAALAMGPSRLDTVADGRLSIDASPYSRYNSSFGTYSSGETMKAIFPEAPAGVTRNELQPLLESSDRRRAALAAYLLVLLDDGEVFGVLRSYWDRSARSNDNWTRLVYRAIAFLDDERFIPDLIWIYENSISKNEFSSEIKEFYWTIRIMTGPEALALRKRIRDEVGMDALR